MKKLLIKLLIIQVIDNTKRKDKELGRGFTKAYRLNPWNPLSYVTIVIALLLGLVCFGVVGMWKEYDNKNPFKWY